MVNTERASGAIYEFCGAPGAGKTYIASQLVSRKLPDAQLVSFCGQRRWRRFLLKMLCILRHPGIVSGHFFTNLGIVKLYEPRAREFIKLLYNMSFICGIVLGRREGRALVLDQGLIQAGWSNAYHGRVLPDGVQLAGCFANLIEQLGVRSLVVVDVRVHHDMVRERIDSRDHGNSPLDGHGGDWSRAQGALEYMASFLEALEKSCPVVRRVVIDNSGDGITCEDIEKIVY
jgi:hypothetical protein